MEVNVFVFEHRHGRDVTAYASEELAVAEGARIAREWWSEACELDPSLPNSAPADDANAMELYFAAQEGREFYEIVACPVQGAERSWLRHRAAMILAIAVRRLAQRPCAEVPAALRFDGAGAIVELFNASDDSELSMLDEVVERAGLGWKCQAEVAGFPCHYMNVGSAICGECGADEAQGKEEGDG